MFELTEKISVSMDEKETVWNKHYVDGKPVYEMYTSDRTDMLKALKLANKYPEDVKILTDDKYGTSFSFSSKGGSLFWKPKSRYKMTEEQRQAVAERLRSYRENRT